ncbi:MAG: shikimate kinase [Candidatus Shikimatogenerans bostrichidophilus]|nr:MAG: shikimate kinase [Candidatus Shikimatogenerans bostrichidophilus]
MKIILMGYMGCGKTYIGKLLSKKINYFHIDLDNIIELSFNIKINLFFKKYGEKFFRLIEHNLLKFIIKYININNYILSLGGGTPCYYNNLKYLKKNFTIYLKTNYKILFKRLNNDNENRPILKKYRNKKLFFFIKNHIKKREKYYKQSKIIFNSNYILFKDIVVLIKEKVLNV